jgi:hypothetical protein
LFRFLGLFFRLRRLGLDWFNCNRVWLCLDHRNIRGGRQCRTLLVQNIDDYWLFYHKRF